jgi:hypothetical protein
MGNKFDRLSSDVKEKIGYEIESIRKDILKIHENLTEYKFVKTNDNMIKIRLIAQNLENKYNVFISQYFQYLGTIQGYRKLSGALIAMKHLDVKSDQKQLDEIYRELEEADKLLLENKRKHFTPDTYAVTNITVSSNFGPSGPEAGIEVDIERERKF